MISVLKQHGYTQAQIDEVVMIFGQKESRNSKKALVLITIVILIGLCGALAYALVKEQQPAVNETNPSKNSMTSKTTDIDCAQIHEIGYIAGLNDRSVDELDITIPDNCSNEFALGLDAGKTEREAQFQDSIDTTRKQHLSLIANAVYQYVSNNNGQFPDGVTTVPMTIGTGDGQLNILDQLTPYLGESTNTNQEFPYDPETGNPNSTGYILYLLENGRIVVEAKNSKNPEMPLQVVR